MLISRRHLLAALPACGYSVLRAADAPLRAKLADWKNVPELRQFAKAIAFLEDPASLRLPAGKHPIDGERIFANIARGATRDPATARFEVHRKYADIHYLATGSEMIGFAPLAGLTIAEEYKEADDAAMYALPKEYTRLIMRPGDLALFRPGQPHLPGCHAGKPGELHKIVLKIRM